MKYIVIFLLWANFACKCNFLSPFFMLPNPYVKQQLIIRPSRLFHVQGFAFAMYYYFGLFYTMTQQSTKNGLRETYITCYNYKK